MIKRILKLKPVALLGAFYTIVGAVLALDSTEHFLPAGVARWITIIGTLVGVGLTVLAHQNVTPLAKPRAADGTPLVKAD